MKKTQDGGWQANVEYFDNYVIKTPKEKSEIISKIRKSLERTGELYKLDGLVENMQLDWDVSMKIIKKTTMPRELFANLEFLENGKIRQSRATIVKDILEEFVEKGDMLNAKNTIDCVIDFMIELWRYGVGEKTFKFQTEYGVLNNQIVLVDIGEVTDNKETIKKQIMNQSPDFKAVRGYYNEELLDYFLEQRKERMTLDVFEEVWRSKLII